jgi:hypothetical protein
MSKKNKRGLDFSGTYKRLVYADRFKIQDGSTKTKKNKEGYLKAASKEVDLEINAKEI